MDKELIRIEIMNLTLDQWKKIEEIEHHGFVEITPKQFIDLVGFDGGMFFSLKANDRELKFIKEVYKIGNAMNK